MWIKKGAHLSFHAIVGDHRTKVIEIIPHLIYRKEPPEIAPPKARKLT